MKAHRRSSFTWCTFALSSSGASVQLFPAGPFRARDGRPTALDAWRIDAAIASRLIEQARARATPYVIDYEHQSLLAEQNGQPAPAAGWFRTLEWRKGDGLYAVGVQWTERAKAFIDSHEYQFISPVFSFDPKTGDITGLHSAALTNTPAIDGMQAVLAARLQTFQQETPMHKSVLTLLGLTDQEPSDEQISAACARITEKLAALEAKDTEIAALKTKVPDPAQYAPVAALTAMQAELAALKAKDVARDIDDLIEPALSDGRLLPAQEQWARELDTTNLAALKQYLATRLQGRGIHSIRPVAASSVMQER